MARLVTLGTVTPRNSMCQRRTNLRGSPAWEFRRCATPGYTDIAENAIHNAMYRGSAFPSLPTHYWALFTTLPSEAGTGGVEPTAATYARVAVTADTTNYKDPSTATQGEVKNLTKIVWPVINIAIGSVVGFGWFDAITAGNCWMWIDSTDITVDALGQPFVDVNGFTHALD